MSFRLPSNIPNFDNAQRRFEDNVWNKFSGNEKGLPMYKDKPTGYGAKRSAGSWGKKRVGVVVLLVLGAIYWFGWSSSGGTEAVESGKDAGWRGSIIPGKKGKIDWGTRRESVKDAFLLSWKGYEQHGWGTLRTFWLREYCRTAELTVSGYDEYHPVSRNGRFMAEPNGMGWIIVDALDTLMIMNLTKELKSARDWCLRH